MALSRGDMARVVRHALWIAVVPSAWIVLSSAGGFIGRDSAHAYWNVWRLGPYQTAPGSIDAFNYSPAFAQAIYPLTLLPWPAFITVWSLAICGALLWLLWPLGTRWRWLAVAYTAPAAVVIGNIEPFLAVAAVLGLRHPAAWAFPLLTKVTPGLGPVWFAVRREWASCAVAVGSTLAVVAASVAAAPGLWSSWIEFLADNAGLATPYLPLWARLPVALGLVVWAASRGRSRWLPLAMVLAMPLWSSGVLLLLAAIPRLGERRRPSASPGEATGVDAQRASRG